MTRQISLPDVRRRSRLLEELRHEPVSGNTMFRNPDLFSTPSAPSSDAGHANDQLHPAVLATIREAIVDNKTTYKWRGVSYAVPPDMLSTWHQAAAQVAASPPRPESHMSRLGVNSSNTKVIDLTSDDSDSETDHQAESVRAIPGTMKERSARWSPAGNKSASHGTLSTTATGISKVHLNHEQDDDYENAERRDSKADLQRDRVMPSNPMEMDEALSAITLEACWHSIGEPPKISLQACYTARALFDRIRSARPAYSWLANATIKVLLVYLPDNPDNREVSVHEGNELEYQVLVSTLVRDGVSTASGIVRWHW